jgi:enterochelin esterase-like enzyme
MTEWQVEEPLARIPGTDLFHRSYAAEPGTRWEYRMNVDFENLQPDPLNPRRVSGRDGDLSEVWTAGFERSTWRRAYAGALQGSLESFQLTSKVLENERTIDVYLPAGYAQGSRRYPLVIALDGQGWRDFGQLPNVLDHLAEGASAPLIVAFVNTPAGGRGEFGGGRFEGYAKMVAEELVPELDRRYRTAAKPEQRAVLGAGSGAAYAAYAALAFPQVIGKAAVTSPLVGPGKDKLFAAADAVDAASKPVFEITWNRHDLHRTDWNADITRDSRELVEKLEQKGFKVGGREVSDSSGWGAWPVRAGEMLTALFPRS